MNVKVLANQNFLERLLMAIDGQEGVGINFERFGNFRDVFGEDNYGFILSGDLLNEVKTGNKAPVYTFGDKFYPIVSGEGVNCELFLPSAFSTELGKLPSRSDVYSIMNYLEVNKDSGNIENLINSKKGTLSEDKKSILELQNIGFPTPKTLYFDDFNDMKDFLEDQEKNYVLKHCFGEQGQFLYKVNRENISNFSGLNIEDYILQEELDILSEKRIILFDNEFLGSRVIYDRTRPWEDKKISNRKHSEEKYQATQEEIQDTREIMSYFDSKLGCVDWVEVKDKGRFYLEYNGVGTGWGIGTHPYNFNREVAEKLKDKYFK
jgi:hypothetical protein